LRSQEKLAEDRAWHEEASEALESVMVEISTGPNPGGLDIFQERIGYLNWVHLWFPFHTTYEELVATGNLDLITSDSLRSALVEYDREIRLNYDYDLYVDDFADNVGFPLVVRDLVGYKDFSPPEYRHRVQVEAPFQTDYSSFYDNREMWNVLALKLDVERGCSEYREPLMAVLQTVLAFTEAELERRGEQIH